MKVAFVALAVMMAYPVLPPLGDGYDAGVSTRAQIDAHMQMTIYPKVIDGHWLRFLGDLKACWGNGYGLGTDEGPIVGVKEWR